MAKVLTGASMSLDGYIAGPDETGFEYVTARAALTRDPARRADIAKAAVVHGYTVAIWWAVGVLLLAALVAGAMVTAKAPERRGAE